MAKGRPHAKPQRWAPNRAFVHPDWQWVWDGLTSAPLLWEGGGERNYDYAQRDWLPWTNSAQITWLMGDYGLELDFTGVGSAYVDCGFVPADSACTMLCICTGDTAPGSSQEDGPFYADEQGSFSWDHGSSPFRGAWVIKAGGTFHAASFGTLTAGVPYVLVGTYDGETMRAFKDGVLITENTSPSGALDSTAATMKIGTNSARVGEEFNGKVALPLRWNYGMSVPQVRKISLQPYKGFAFEPFDLGSAIVGGTVHTITPSGNVTPAGALAKEAQQALAGSSAPAGTLTLEPAKALAGSVTPAAELAKQPQKALAGSTTPSGVLGTAVVKAQAFAGTITPSGALVRQAQQGLAGTVTPAGALVKDATKALAGTITPAGSLAKRAAKALAGALSSLVGVVATSLGGAPTPVKITGTLDVDATITGTLDTDATITATLDTDTLITGTLDGP